MNPERSSSWRLGRVAMGWSLACAHAWGTLLVLAVYFGKDSAIIGEMFDAVGWMIFTTLGILVGGKGWKDFAAMRWHDGGKGGGDE